MLFFFNASLHHCDDPIRALSHCYESLNKGGVLFLVNENFIRPWMTKARFYHLMETRPEAMGNYGGNEHTFYNWEYIQMLRKSKFNNFGTGNNESLKDITKDDILNFYNKYYTTDNMFVCIADSNKIDFMTKNYVKYFDDIPTKIYTNTTNLERFNSEDLILKDENTIVFKSSSTYSFLNFYIILPCDEKNQFDYQLNFAQST